MNEQKQNQRQHAPAPASLLGVAVSKAKQILGYGSEKCNDDTDDDYPYWLFIPWLIGILIGLGLL